PTVPVHDLKIHPREHELIAATHGRGLWIVEISPLEQLTSTVLAAGAYLFDPKTAYEYGEPTRGSFSAGQQWFRAPSPAYGAGVAVAAASAPRPVASPSGPVRPRHAPSPRAGSRCRRCRPRVARGARPRRTPAPWANWACCCGRPACAAPAVVAGAAAASVPSASSPRRSDAPAQVVAAAVSAAAAPRRWRAATISSASPWMARR